MYYPHPCFSPPPDENAAIWRYVDFAKLVSLLLTKSLHFARIDTFDDQFEGALPMKFVERARQVREDFRKEHPDRYEQGRKLGQLKEFATSEYREQRPRTVVNCWHQNDHESAAMWSQYVKSGDGVAIRSTYRRLTKAFDPDDKTVLVCVGMVHYLDYDQDEIKSFHNLLLPIVHKRKSFQHEQELRAVAFGADNNLTAPALDLRNFEESGFDLSVDLKQLVEAIFVAPSSPSWFKESVESVCEMYRLNVPVNQSSLDAQPMW